MKLLRSLIRVAVLLALILGGLMYLVMPLIPPEPKVAVGGYGRLGGLENGVWIALGDDNFDSMIDAQNIAAAKHSGAALHKLAEAGKIKFYAIGTPVVVTDTGPGHLKSRSPAAQTPETGAGYRLSSFKAGNLPPAPVPFEPSPEDAADYELWLDQVEAMSQPWPAEFPCIDDVYFAAVQNGAVG